VKNYLKITLSKLITTTREIRTDSVEITCKDAFLCSLCRLVLLEMLSGFDVAWHDR
jgi:hypothetical protein